MLELEVACVSWPIRRHLPPAWLRRRKNKMARRRFGSDVEQAIANSAQRWGIPLPVMRAFAGIESGGNPRDAKGSYSGLYALSRSEFQRGGGRGSILDPHQNAMAAGRIIAGHREELARTLGREPTWNEVYLAHQQGPGGLQEHMQNPSRLAWQSMAATAEGRRRDADGPIHQLPDGSMGLWSQLAIAGNIPQEARRAGVNWRTATSADFMQAWSERLERGGVPTMAAQIAASEAPQIDMNPQVGPRDLSALSASELTRLDPRDDSPYAESGIAPVLQQVQDTIQPAIVQGNDVNAGLNIGNIFGQRNIPGASRIGAAFSAAGKAIAGAGVRMPAMDDPAKQMAALDPGGQWPTLAQRPRRQFGRG